MSTKAMRKIQLAREVPATPGTDLPATALWRGLGTMEDQAPFTIVDEDIGHLLGYERGYFPHYQAGLTLEATPATFEQLPYILAGGIYGLVAGVADGGGTGHVYAYPFPTTTATTIQTYTIEGGDEWEMEQAHYCFVKDFTLAGKGGEAVTMEANLVGRQLHRLQYGRVITIAGVAGTSFTDAANGFAVFLTGTTIRVRGTTINDGIYTVAGGGVAGTITTTEATQLEVAGDSVMVQDWFSGGPTGLTPVAVEEILTSKGRMYIDAIGAAFGTTIKSNTLLDFSLKVTTGWNPIFTADGVATETASFGFHKFVRPEVVLDVTFEHNESATDEKAIWRARTGRKVELIFQGSLLTTAAGYTYKTLTIDLPIVWEKFDKLGEQNGNDIIHAVARMRSAAAAPTVTGTITVVNEVHSLP